MESADTKSPDDFVRHRRMLYMVLSPRSLPYARLALRSLFEKVLEPVHLSLITDTAVDKEILIAKLSSFADGPDTNRHHWEVFSEQDLDEREADQFANLDHLRSFRRGHPCWRKITDPLLLSAERQEMILLDPDLYFPNRFRFEQTPDTGLLLMWQKPCCLFPPEVVNTAINAAIPLAHHVDIGVAHWRAPVDIEWLNWLIGRLGAQNLPHSMHVEAIVWAALTMRLGGAYLDPRHWLCWHRSQVKRILLRLGANGTSILQRERFDGVKCFHAGGEAKWWLPEAAALGILDCNEDLPNSGTSIPFVELSSTIFTRLQRHRAWARCLGYYSLFHK
jgi:hypothetical protein